LGLDSRRQEVSWEESDTKKKRRAGDSKKSTDRYFSAASQRLLRSELPVPVLPVTPDGNSAISSAYFLALGDDEGDNKGRGTGKFRTKYTKKSTVTADLGVPHEN